MKPSHDLEQRLPIMNQPVTVFYAGLTIKKQEGHKSSTVQEVCVSFSQVEACYENSFTKPHLIKDCFHTFQVDYVLTTWLHVLISGVTLHDRPTRELPFLSRTLSIRRLDTKLVTLHFR